MRANLLSFERQIQARIPVQHPILTWLVTYAASIRNMRVRGQDGRTAQQLARGSGASARLIPFGQMCRYKARSKEKGIGPDFLRWSSGVYLGLERRTGQYIIYDQQIVSVHHARTIAQVPTPSKWSIDRVKEMLTTTWKQHLPTTHEAIEHKPIEQVATTDKTATIRRLYIRQDDLDTHGYTQHCPKCQHIMTYGSETPATMSHSTQCRNRITEAIGATPAGRARLDKLVEKENRHLAEHIRWQAESDTAQAQGEMDSNVQAPETVPPPLGFVPFSATTVPGPLFEDGPAPAPGPLFEDGLAPTLPQTPIAEPSDQGDMA